MAKFIPFLGDLSGKLKGLVFAYNKAGSYVRGFRMPTDPATVAQLNNRSFFANAVSTWHGLNDIVKGLWNAYAVTDFKAKFPKSGVAYSGYNAFVSLYNVAKNAIIKAADPVMDIPVVAGITAIPYQILDSPPLTGFSSSIQAPIGVPLGMSVGYVQVIAGVCTLGIDFDRSVGSGPTPEGPVFLDAIGQIPVGFAVVGSLPITQEQQFVENPDINLIAISNPISEIDSWVISDTIGLSMPLVPEYYTRKNTYVGGDLVQYKVYLVGRGGQTQLLGSAVSSVSI